jgi:ribosomal protein S18 acetylase RimI-like enzyme
VQLSVAGPEDLAGLVELMLEFSIESAAPLSKEHIEQAVQPLLEDNLLGVILLARQHIAVGYLVMSFSWGIESGGKEALIDEVFVAPQLRNQGLGSALAELANEHARLQGVKMVFLETEKPNVRVRELYGRLGFELEDSIWLKKRL